MTDVIAGTPGSNARAAREDEVGVILDGLEYPAVVGSQRIAVPLNQMPAAAWTGAITAVKPGVGSGWRIQAWR